MYPSVSETGGIPRCLSTRRTITIIQLGEIYWVQAGISDDAEPRIPHPHVVIQLINDNDQPDKQTVVMCAITTNAKKFNFPGNVLLEKGEAQLSRQSAVEVSKTLTIDADLLGAYIGMLSDQRMTQIRAGIRFVQRSFLHR